MIKCNASGRRCHVMKVVQENPLSGSVPRGVLCWSDDDGHEDIVYSLKIKGQGHSTEYVMPYCPWCGARLRMTPAQREEKRAKAKT